MEKAESRAEPCGGYSSTLAFTQMQIFSRISAYDIFFYSLEIVYEICIR
jgi:hypothetical protein